MVSCAKGRVRSHVGCRGVRIPYRPEQPRLFGLQSRPKLVLHYLLFHPRKAYFVSAPASFINSLRIVRNIQRILEG